VRIESCVVAREHAAPERNRRLLLFLVAQIREHLDAFDLVKVAPAPRQHRSRRAGQRSPLAICALQCRMPAGALTAGWQQAPRVCNGACAARVCSLQHLNSARRVSTARCAFGIPLQPSIRVVPSRLFRTGTCSTTNMRKVVVCLLRIYIIHVVVCQRDELAIGRRSNEADENTCSRRVLGRQQA